jgi:hypothetical protein
MRRFASATVAVIASVAAAACGGSSFSDLFEQDAFTASVDSGGVKTDSGGVSGADGGVSSNDSGGNPDTGAQVKDAGIDTGPTGATKCTVGSDGVESGCASDEACLSSDCTTGTCAKINASNTDYSPVCGCDTINYWNSAVAAGFIAGIKGTGACAAPASCTGASPNGTCGLLASADCAYERDNAGAVCGLQKTGVCWGMPSSCPSTKAGITPCTVSTANCVTLCDAIKQQTPFRAATCTVP